MSDLLIESLKNSVGLTIKIYTIKDYYFEGICLACDSSYLKFNDRKQGVRLMAISEIKEVSLK